MVAIVNGQRQDAHLASTEGSSGMIRFVKASPKIKKTRVLQLLSGKESCHAAYASLSNTHLLSPD
ncbi:MAG: hypothetical protein IPQ25_08520 [Chitinophagaceae bacterium]|nr:hypothetical protein [Chitinophagaceae bacterium]